MTSESNGSITKTYFHKKKLKDPIFLQFLFTFAFKILHSENLSRASKKWVGTLADYTYLQYAKLEKILLSNMEDICVFVI